MWATDKEDICVHFAKLRLIHENLALMGQPRTNSDLYTAILGSLPSLYENYISAVIATSSVLGKTLTANELIWTVTKKYKCWLIRNSKGSSSKDVAFVVNNKKSDKKDKKCFNCGKKGHMKKDCWAPGSGKEGQGPSCRKGKQVEKVSVAKADKKTENAAWLAMADINIFEFDEVMRISVPRQAMMKVLSLMKIPILILRLIPRMTTGAPCLVYKLSLTQTVMLGL